MSYFPFINTASAQGLSSVAQVQQTGTLINAINTNIVSAIGVLLLALTVIAFFAGMVRFIWAIRQGEEKKATEGKRFMLWSLLAVFVVFSIYGIIIFMQMTLLGKRAETTIGKPCLNFISGCSGSVTAEQPTGTPSSGSGGGETASQDDCIKNQKNTGDACVLPTGSTGKCTDVFGSLSCQPTTSGGYVECSPKTEGGKCLINGQEGTCKNVGLDTICSPNGVSVTTDDQDCNKAGSTCQGTDSNGTVANGTCKSNGAGGFYCDVPRPNAITSPCGGKAFGDTCNAGEGVAGQCIRKDATSALYCAVMVGNSNPDTTDTSAGSVILSEGQGCVYDAPTNKVCGAGLSCKYKLTTGGNKLYTCQK